ncbi:MAG: large subunit ribosomal protein L13 [Parcubacteria group bacterium Gr01-1014_19]|nr:MAG: large subunit ribosomal protein L13 [Parcubacteria group bacterium Gr01-1014_19]
MEHVIDAKNQRLGRLASQIAQILQGKLHADYAPNKEGKDRVVVKNASQIVVSGKKATQKVYYHHTGYMGHLKEKVYKDAFEKSPEKVLVLAVKRMLPQNFLKQKRLNRLVIEK